MNETPVGNPNVRITVLEFDVHVIVCYPRQTPYFI